jgi:hypothetical protein
MVGQVAREQDAGARRLKRLALPIAMPEDRHVPSEKHDQRLDHERGELLERIVVLLAGAAGMLAFERDATTAAGGIHDFGTALWWTAMVLTTKAPTTSLSRERDVRCVSRSPSTASPCSAT